MVRDQVVQKRLQIGFIVPMFAKKGPMASNDVFWVSASSAKQHDTSPVLTDW